MSIYFSSSVELYVVIELKLLEQLSQSRREVLPQCLQDSPPGETFSFKMNLRQIVIVLKFD